MKSPDHRCTGPLVGVAATEGPARTSARSTATARRALTIAVTALAALTLALFGTLPATAATSDDVGIEIDAPDLTRGEGLQSVEVAVTNETSRRAMSHLVIELDPPAGWSSAPEEQELAPNITLRLGESTTATFTVRVPMIRDGFRQYPFDATVTYRGGDGVGTSTEEVVVTSGTPFESVAAAYDNVGTTSIATSTEGDFDGGGNSFSDEQLTEVGLTPGASVEALGATFTWPDTAAGEPDNVAAGGQAISVDGTGNSLAFLASGSSTNATGAVTVRYTDGSTSSG